MEDGIGSCTSDMMKIDVAALEMAVAIGAQARASGQEDTQCAAAYVTRARRVAFDGMLVSPSLSMVRLFVLLAFYTLGDCQQNAAFIYLGVASKAAIILGLHQPMSWKSAHKEEWPHSRLRIWHSLCILDVLTSSILGRPCTVPRATRHDLNYLPLDATQPSFNACLKGAALLDDICRILSRGVIIDVPTAEDLLEKLRLWSQGLPPSLRQFSPTETYSFDSADRKAFLEKIHVSSLYYFAVILVTRPFLIQHLMYKLRQKPTDEHSTLSDPKTLADPKIAGLAQVCMSSAAYVGDLCQKLAVVANLSDLPIGNLCLFKAWIFSAGLILGFSLFTGDSRPDFQDNFAGVCEVLKRIGEANPQSRLYSEILCTFHDTIRIRRQQLSHRARRAVDQYIDQILVINVNEGADHGGPTPITDYDNETARTSGGDVNLGLIEQVEWDEGWLAQYNWDDVSMQFSDNFTIDHIAGFS